MSERRVGVSVRAELVGEPVDGVWCTPCKLPSVTAALVAVYVDANLHGVQLAQVCNDCGDEVMA